MGDEIRVSEKEVAKVEAEIKAKELSTQDRIRAEATEQIRKEFETEQRLKEAESRASQSSEQLKALQEQLEAMKKANDDLLSKKVEERMAEVEAKRKAFVPPSANPFATPQQKSPVEGLTPQQLAQVAEASFEAFRARGNLKQ